MVIRSDPELNKHNHREIKNNEIKTTIKYKSICILDKL
jgi:hypothetical protein